MNVLILGASGFIGQRLTQRLLRDGHLGGDDNRPIATLLLTDITTPGRPQDNNDNDGQQKPHPIKVMGFAMDITNERIVQDVILRRLPDVIFHLAAVLSGDAEQDFDKGYRVNVDATRQLLDIIKSKPDYTPRLIFASSLAVYGPPFVMPSSSVALPDSHAATPRGSYGTQKAIVELYIEDYSRKGYVNGMSIRFPTIAIRPGKPNAAASSFISGLIREPLHGQETVIPVAPTCRHFIASPTAAVAFLIHAAATLGSVPNTLQQPGDRTLQMPGLSVTVHDMVQTLQDIVGQEAVTRLVRYEPNEFIASIVDTWPTDLQATRARALGFQPDVSYHDMVWEFIQQDKVLREKYLSKTEYGT